MGAGSWAAAGAGVSEGAGDGAGAGDVGCEAPDLSFEPDSAGSLEQAARASIRPTSTRLKTTETTDFDLINVTPATNLPCGSIRRFRRVRDAGATVGHISPSILRPRQPPCSVQGQIVWHCADGGTSGNQTWDGAASADRRSRRIRRARFAGNGRAGASAEPLANEVRRCHPILEEGL